MQFPLSTNPVPFLASLGHVPTVLTSQPKIDNLCLLEYECLGNLQMTSCYYQFLQQFQSF